jgi:glycosyltransferase involved in cell wall biosynthesis
MTPETTGITLSKFVPPPAPEKYRTIAVMPAYNAASTLRQTVGDIPAGSVDEVILVDDGSRDDTVAVARSLGLTVVVHEQNPGYGGNQKTCYRKALEAGADYIVMIHPDYQYDSRLIPVAIEILRLGICDCVLGSRIRTRGEVLAGGNEKLVLAQTWEFPLRDRARTVTISGPRIGFIVYHLGLPVMDLHYLEGEQVVDLDWLDPWNSRFRNAKLHRQYDARVSAFLYVEPYEVRVEIVARPIDLGLWNSRTIPLEAQERLKDTAAAALASTFVLTIDGKPTKPELDKVYFLRRRLWNSSVIDPPEILNSSSATLGAVFVIPATGYPREAALTWNRFDPTIHLVTAAATDEAGPRPAILRPRNNILRWENLAKRAAPAVSTESALVAQETVRVMWQYVQKAGTTEKLTEGDLNDLVDYLKIL